MSIYETVKGEINEMIGSAQAFAPKSKKPTATEAVQAKQMAIKMLGLSVLAVMRLKKNMTFLRIYNILDNFTKSTHKIVDPVSSKVTEAYARFTIQEAELGGGSIGSKIVQFSDTNMSSTDQFANYAKEQQQKKLGNHVAFKNVNVKLLHAVKPNWYVNIVSKERDSSEISKAMFKDKTEQAVAVMNITGMKINPTKLVDSFERTWKERDLFQREAPPQPGQQPQQPGRPQGASQPGSQPAQQMQQPAGQPQKPTVNTMNQVGNQGQ
jgi:hypothetical protein